MAGLCNGPLQRNDIELPAAQSRLSDNSLSKLEMAPSAPFRLRNWTSVSVSTKCADQTLRKTVRPVMAEYPKNTAFFFVRVADPSETIRLRVDSSAILDKRAFLNRLRQLSPHGPVEFVEYRREISRYDGPVGMGIAEFLFTASSQCVLSQCMARDLTKRSIRLTSAVIAIVQTLRAMTNQAEFGAWAANAFAKAWRSSVSRRRGDDWMYSIVEHDALVQHLTPAIAGLWLAPRETEMTFGRCWFASCKTAFGAYEYLAKRQTDDRNSRITSFAADPSKYSGKSRRLADFCGNILHMHINRCGLSNTEEALAYGVTGTLLKSTGPS